MDQFSAESKHPVLYFVPNQFDSLGKFSILVLESFQQSRVLPVNFIYVTACSGDFWWRTGLTAGFLGNRSIKSAWASSIIPFRFAGSSRTNLHYNDHLSKERAAQAGKSIGPSDHKATRSQSRSAY
jgi:hypothetical protein